jgi:hypothetical protein
MSGTRFPATGAITAVEESFVAAVESGECWWPYKADTKRRQANKVIRAKLIQAMMLGIAVQRPGRAKAELVNFTPKGIRIGPNTVSPKTWTEHARVTIDGVLNLQWAAATGDNLLPPLGLEYCEFSHAIDLTGINIANLSFAGSRFSALRLRDANIQGTLDLSLCGPTTNRIDAKDSQPPADQRHFWPFTGNLFALDTAAAPAAGVTGTDRYPTNFIALADDQRARMLPKGCSLAACTVNIDGAVIDGNIDIIGSDFVRLPAMACPFGGTSGPVDAFSAVGTRISGRLHVIQSTIIGGMNLRSIRIEEDMLVAGSRLMSGGAAAAFNIQSAQIIGMLQIRFAQDYVVEMFAQQSGRADFAHSIIIGGFIAYDAKIGTFWMAGTVGEGWMLLEGAEISGGVHFGPFRPNSAKGPRSPADAGCWHGKVDLVDSKILSLEIDDFGATPFGKKEGSVTTLLALNHVWADLFELPPAHSYTALFQVILTSATVDLYVKAECTRLIAQEDDDLALSTALDLFKASVDRGVSLSESVECHGAIRCNRADIGRQLLIRCWRIATTRRSKAPRGPNKPSFVATAVDLRGARINGDVELGVQFMQGPLKADNLSVTGDLRICATEFSVPHVQFDGRHPAIIPQYHPVTMIDLTGAQVGNCLSVSKLRWARHQFNIDMTGDRAAAALYPESRLWLFTQPDSTLRVIALACFPKAVLVEAHSPDGRYQRVLFHYHGEAMLYPLDGKSGVFHTYRSRLDQPVDLSSDRARRDFLACFCEHLLANAVESIPETKRQLDADGQAKPVIDVFALLDGVEPTMLAIDPDAPALPLADGPFKGMAIGDLRSVGRRDGGWAYNATVRFGIGVFFAQFVIGDDGSVEMAEDMQLGALTVDLVDEGGIERPVRRTPGVSYRQLGRVLNPKKAKPFIDAFTASLFNRTMAEIDLERLQCGMLEDGFGSGWGIDHRHVRLRLGGLAIGNGEPAAKAARGDEHLFPGGTTEASPSLGARAPDPVVRRLKWLEQQFDWTGTKLSERTVRNDHRWWPMQWHGNSERYATRYIPQSWDVFANAHIRAGDISDGRKIIVERRDLDAARLGDNFRRYFWGRPNLFSGGIRQWAVDWLTMLRGHRHLLNAGRQFYCTATGAVLLCAAVLAGMIWQTGEDPMTLATSNGWALALVLVGGSAILSLVMPWLAMVAMWFFRAGFVYGLSSARALRTVMILLAIGSLGTHYARTGTLVSLNTDWAALEVPTADPDDPEGTTVLSEHIALVLLAGYEPNAPEPEPPEKAPPNAAETQPPGIPGQLVYARATPCNLGVSSILYAVDVFIPLLDLDQESRCTIREELESDRSYTSWRVAKVFYEILGWIVMSLLILTISGVMRRDMER